MSVIQSTDSDDNAFLIERALSCMSILSEKDSDNSSCDRLLALWSEALLLESCCQGIAPYAIPDTNFGPYDLDKPGRSCELASLLALMFPRSWSIDERSASNTIEPGAGKSIFGHMVLRGNLNESTAVVLGALQDALSDMLKGAALSGIKVSVSTSRWNTKTDGMLPVDAMAGLQCTFIIALDDPSDIDAVLEMLRLESLYGGACGLMPRLVEVFEAATHLKLRLEITDPLPLS